MRRADELRIELAHGADARRGRGDDDIVGGEDIEEPLRECARLVAVAAVEMHLPAARLLLGEHDLMTQALEDLHGRLRRLGKQRVAEAGDEEGDPHGYVLPAIVQPLLAA